MNDSYVECLVARKKSGLMGLLKVVLMVLTVILVLMGMVVFPFLIAALVTGVGTWFASMYASMEFEYLYVDREITVDKVLNKSRRKKGEKFDVGRIEILAPIKSWHLDSYKNRQFKVTDYSSGIEGQPDRRYAMISDGGRKVLLEPSAEFVKAVQSVAPRKVFFD